MRTYLGLSHGAGRKALQEHAGGTFADVTTEVGLDKVFSHGWNYGVWTTRISDFLPGHRKP